MMLSRIFITAALIFTTSNAFADKSESLTVPSQSKIDAIDVFINNAISSKVFPGAQLVIGTKNGITFSRNYGCQDYNSGSPEISDDDIYDVASCTKVISTTLAVMTLVDSGKLSLSSQVGTIIPEFKGTAIASLQLRELLTHTTGLNAVIPVYKYLVTTGNDSPLLVYKPTEGFSLFDTDVYINNSIKPNDKLMSKAHNEGWYHFGDSVYINGKDYIKVIDSLVVDAYNPARRGQYRYSDVNFFLVGRMVECVTSKPLDKYVSSIYSRIGVDNIGYKPLEWKPRNHVVPTECDYLTLRDTVRGYVHDEFAASLGGVSGNAGVFSNAKAMGVICTLFLNEGKYGDRQIISPTTIRLFTAKQRRIYRGLGFDKVNPDKAPYSGESYGHTGFTGTFFWVDPTSDRFVVLLTNRVHPSRINKQLSQGFRRELWTMLL